MIKYCTVCLLPETKPDLYFDENGKCAACISFQSRANIDWQSRENEFLEIVSKYKRNSSWDCVIPVSGGKDSTVQVLKILELGLTPLCVTATTCDLTEIGRHNIENIKKLGVDLIEFSPNPNVRKRLNRVALENVGDIAWPEHVGIFTIPVRAAVNYKVPLIIWGENSQNEYGGPAADAEKNYLDRGWLEEFGGLLGLRVTDLINNFNFKQEELLPYFYPDDDELKKNGITGLFLGHYFPWDGLSNFLLATANGFSSNGKNIEGSAVSYENLDNFQHGIHDYFKFLKFGYGRATDLVSMHIRRGRLTRSQGLAIVKRLDGKYPASYLGKTLAEIIEPLGLDLKDFDKICERFTNTQIFKKDNNGNLLFDGLDLVKINYDNDD
jgi:N-acetyl sugar amidotransferase